MQGDTVVVLDGYRPPARFALACVAVIGGIDGYVWTFTPQFATSTAYDFATSILPQRGWGIVFLVSSILAAVALVERRWKLPEPVRALTATAALAIHGLACGTVGLSIFVLTARGIESAVTGATKWWLPLAIAARVLSRDFVTGAPLTSSHRWPGPEGGPAA